jgi:hypothetical protein
MTDVGCGGIRLRRMKPITREFQTSAHALVMKSGTGWSARSSVSSDQRIDHVEDEVR